MKTSGSIALFLFFLSLHTPLISQDYDELREGEFYALGALCGHIEGSIVVETVYADTAASRAGLRNGDHILRVNDQRSFKSIDDFLRRLRAQAKEFNGCVLLRVQRPDDGTLRQTLAMCEAVRKEGEQWQWRPMKHSPFARFVFETGAVGASYENEIQHAPSQSQVRKAIDFVSRMYSDWADAYGLVNVKGLPQDLRKAHARLRTTIETAGMWFSGLSEEDPDRGLQVTARSEEAIQKAFMEWASLIRYYDTERKLSKKEDGDK